MSGLVFLSVLFISTSLFNRCRECSTILLSGTYKAGKEPGAFICKTHTEKPLTAPTTHITVPPPKTQSTYITKTDQNASGGGTGKAGLTPNASKPGWLTNKSDRIPTSGLVGTSTPAVRLSPAPKTTPTPETTTLKTSYNPRTPTEPLKAVSNSAQKNQEARKRWMSFGLVSEYSMCKTFYILDKKIICDQCWPTV